MTVRCILLVTICWLETAIAAIPLVAQAGSGRDGEKEVLPSLRVQDASIPVVSPDGQWVALTIHDPVYSSNEECTRHRYRPRLHPIFRSVGVQVVELTTGQATPLTGACTDSWNPVWGTTGQLLFQSADSIGFHLNVWSPEMTRARRISEGEHVTAVTPYLLPAWSFDDRVAYAPIEDLEIQGQDGNTKDEISLRVERSPFPATEEERGRTNRIPGDILAVDLESGERRVLEGPSWVLVVKASPTDRRIAFLTWASERSPETGAALHDLWVGDPLDWAPTRIARDIQFDRETTWSWSPDGEHIAFLKGVGVVIRDESDDDGQAVVVEVDSGRKVQLMAPGGSPMFSGSSPPLWARDSRSIFVASENRIFQLYLDGEGREIWDGGDEWEVLGPISRLEASESDDDLVIEVRHREDFDFGIWFVSEGRAGARLVWRRSIESMGSPGWVVRRDGVFVFGEGPADPPSVWWVREGRTERIWTGTRDRTSPEGYERRLLRAKDGRGLPLLSAAYLPAGQGEGPFPTIFVTYGGWKDRRGRGSRVEYLASPWNGGLLSPLGWFLGRGYAVVYMDMPLREGRVEVDQLMNVTAIVNRAVEDGIVDEDRMAIMGASFGGYTTALVLANSDRFKAGVSINGSLDPRVFPIEQAVNGFGAFGAPFWRSPGLYDRNSPFSRIDGFETPLLLVVGGQDSRYIVDANRRMFDALAWTGATAEMWTYEDEDHGYWSHESFRDLSRRIVEWIDVRMGPG